MGRNLKKKRKSDLLSSSICAGLTPDDKLSLRDYKIAHKTTYAALVRDALHATYPEVFRRKDV